MLAPRTCLLLLLILISSLTLIWVQTNSSTVAPASTAILASAPSGKSASASSARAPSTKPSWSELTPAQQQALQPLASHWNTLHEGQKRKWLELSKNYAQLPTDNQEKIHSRMTEWVTLSPRQRDLARLNFAHTRELSKKLTPAQKQEKWQAYLTLPEQEKKKLAASKPKTKGAALAVKPVSAKKLAPIPPPLVEPTVSAAPPSVVPLGEGATAPQIPVRTDSGAITNLSTGAPESHR